MGFFSYSAYQNKSNHSSFRVKDKQIFFQNTLQLILVTSFLYGKIHHGKQHEAD